MGGNKKALIGLLIVFALYAVGSNAEAQTYKKTNTFYENN